MLRASFYPKQARYMGTIFARLRSYRRVRDEKSSLREQLGRTRKNSRAHINKAYSFDTNFTIIKLRYNNYFTTVKNYASTDVYGGCNYLTFVNHIKFFYVHLQKLNKIFSVLYININLLILLYSCFY